MSTATPLFSAVEGEVLPPAPPAEVTLTCDQDGCAETFTGPAGGSGSAPMLLGRHRWSVHGISSKGKRRAVKDAPVTAVEDRHPAASAVAEVAAKVRGTGVPRADQLGAALGKGLSLGTILAAGWAVDSDPLIAAELARDPQTAAEHKAALTSLLSLSEASAVKIATPLGRLLAPTAVNRKYGRAVVDNSDAIPALAEVVELGRAWAQFLALRRQHVAALRELTAAQAAAAAGVPAPVPYPTAVPDVPAPFTDPTAGGPAGRVATATHGPQGVHLT